MNIYLVPTLRTRDMAVKKNSQASLTHEIHILLSWTSSLWGPLPGSAILIPLVGKIVVKGTDKTF